MILCIETATPVCSVALLDGTRVISIRENSEQKSHASLLTVFIGEMLVEAGITPHSLSAVAVSKGPGSYTGLRIGVSAAKGFAYRAGLPVIGIDTPLSMFYGMKKIAEERGDLDMNTFFCPMIDARRMEVYHAVYDSDGRAVKSISAEIIDNNSFSEIPADKRIIFAGDGSKKCSQILTRTNMLLYSEFTVSATSMAIPAEQMLLEKRFEDLAYFEPFYLKDFVATVPRKNISLQKGDGI